MAAAKTGKAAGDGLRSDGEKGVRQTHDRVLLMDDGRNAQRLGRQKRRQARITAESDHNGGVQFDDQPPCLAVSAP